jgi:LmbE family N-acetylglucosaminyl deacetylase
MGAVDEPEVPTDQASSARPDRQLPPFPTEFRRVLCVAAHPDDLEYGVACAVATWTDAGATVEYVLATSGEAGIDGLDPQECRVVRQQEERDGAALVGVTSVSFLDHPDGTVEGGLPLRRDLARVIRRVRPDVVVTGNPELRPGWGGIDMADHRAVALAAIDAVRDAGNRWVFRELLAEGLEPWQVRWTALSGASRPTHVVDVTTGLDRGIASLRAHRRYLEGLGDQAPDPETMLRGFTDAARPSFGGRPGIAFEVL